MSYATKDIRNIALLGHGGNGKSTLAESILFLTGVTDRMGSTASGNSVSDFDAEEIRRQISIFPVHDVHGLPENQDKYPGHPGLF